MPRFSDCCKQPGGGSFDMFICQVCGTDSCSGCKFGDRIDLTNVTGFKGTGNVCKTCLKKTNTATEDGPMSLHEYCRIESGGLTGRALDRYISRYYGLD